MNSTAPTGVLFQEEQQFRRPRLWGVLLAVSTATLAAVFTINGLWAAVLLLAADPQGVIRRAGYLESGQPGDRKYY